MVEERRDEGGENAQKKERKNERKEWTKESGYKRPQTQILWFQFNWICMAHTKHSEIILFLSVLHFVEINTSVAAAASGSEFTVSQIDKTNNMSGGTISVRIGEFLKEKKIHPSTFRYC